jgi:hypothetical protein
VVYREASIAGRADWTFTPRFTLQAYVQPLIGAGRYGEFMELARPRSFHFVRYGVDNGSQVEYRPDDGDYAVDPDGPGPAGLFTFTNPDFNIGSKLSRKQLFEKNGTEGRDILYHAHFLKYLRYFVFGPALPRQVIQAFHDCLSDNCVFTGSDMNQLLASVRTSVRRFGIERHAAGEEFFKLAIESCLSVSDARFVRDRALSVR